MLYKAALRGNFIDLKLTLKRRKISELGIKLRKHKKNKRNKINRRNQSKKRRRNQPNNCAISGRGR